jgi:hypothetical protein
MYISRSNFGVSIYKVRSLAMLDSKRCKERQPFTVMGSGRSTPSAAVWSILEMLGVKRTPAGLGEKTISDKADWYQERGQATKNLYAIDRIFVAVQACGCCSVGTIAELAARCVFLPGGTPRIYAALPGITASQAPPSRAEQEPDIHHF